MGKGVTLTGLALALGLICRSAYSQEFDDARGFSRDVLVNLFDKERAATLPPLTAELQGFIHDGDEKARVDQATKFGPVTDVSQIDCQNRDKTSAYRCAGKLSICSMSGSLRSGSLTAKVAACRTSTGLWELDAVMLNITVPVDTTQPKGASAKP